MRRGADPAREAKEVRAAAKLDAERERADAVKAAYTVQRVCDDYHLGYVRLARAKKGSAEVDRMLSTGCSVPCWVIWPVCRQLT